MKIKKMHRLFILFVMLFVGADMNAQNVDIRGYCVFKTKGKEMRKDNEPLKVTQIADTILVGYASLYGNKSLAKSEFERLKRERQAGNRNVIAQAQEHCQFNASGEWDFQGVAPGSIVIVVPYGDYDPKMFTIDKKQTLYIYEIMDDNDGVILGEQVARAKRKRKTKDFKPGVPIDDEGILVWPIYYYLDSKWVKDESRFMIAPQALEYPSDSIIGDIPPAVFDTPKYARTQTRRKNYDYEINDSLSRFMLFTKNMSIDSARKKSPITISDTSVVVQYTFTFKKPDLKKLYYYKGPVELEDYTHVYFADSVVGSPYAKDLWRFLSTDFAVQYGELNREEMYEEPKGNYRTDEQNLALDFEKGKAVLIDSEQNTKIKNSVERDIQKYFYNLQKITIRGAASPEGRLERNKQLAFERSNYARSWLTSRFPGLNVHTTDPYVYTWKDVADYLLEQGHQDLAEDILKKDAAGIAISSANMNGWETIIEPALQHFRVMEMSYQIRLSDPLSPQEAVDKFLHDPDYAEGGKQSFSNGDYYNIYENLNDTLALERLTARIYNSHIKGFRKAKYNNFYAYVANRYLADQLRHATVNEQSIHILDGFVNIDTLRNGFLDSRENGIPVNDGVNGYKINRCAHISNLALTYFQLGKRKWAHILSQLLPENDEKYQAISMLSLLTAKLAQHPEEAEPGLEYAWNASPMSRAVLAVELRDEENGNPLLGERALSEDELLSLLWSLPDDEPRKWYLLGLVTVNDPITQKYSSQTKAQLDELRQKQTQWLEAEENKGNFNAWNSPENKTMQANIEELEEKMKHQEPLGVKDSLPDFLAFLQHSFDLAPDYYNKYYKTDYVFDEKIKREKQKDKKTFTIYRYNPELAAEYRKRFNDIERYMQTNPYPAPDLSDFTNISTPPVSPPEKTISDEPENEGMKHEGESVDVQSKDE